MSDFTTFFPIKARKVHKCYECGQPIEAGTSYVRAAGVFEGMFWTTRTHPGCEWLRAAANRVLNEYPEDGWAEPAELWHEADPSERASLLSWAGVGSMEWPYCFALADLPESEQARVRARIAALTDDAAEIQHERDCEAGRIVFVVTATFPNGSVFPYYATGATREEAEEYAASARECDATTTIREENTGTPAEATE